MSNIKLGVEVVSAVDLLPKDGQGSSSPFVELHFDGQKFRTTVKEKDLNPVWNETFYFNISEPQNLANLSLEAHVFCHAKGGPSASKSLGKACLTGSSFVPFSDAVVLHYPLEKRNFFSRAKGEIGLKVFFTDDPSVRISSNSFTTSAAESLPSYVPDPFSSEDRSEKKRTFRTIPTSSEPKSANSETRAAPAAEPQGTKFPNMFSGGSAPYHSQAMDFAVKETSPHLGGGQVIGGRVFPGKNRPSSTYDLVEKMQYLFIRVVKARDLPTKDVTGSLDPYVEARIGNFKGRTRHFEKRSNPEWNEVFAFAKDNLQSSVLEVVVKDRDVLVDDYVGNVKFDLNEVPTRVPPDSPLAPEWYRLAEKDGNKAKKGELMLAVWFGTQADEAFPEAWHSDAVGPTENAPGVMAHLRSKVYHSPRMWYVRVNVVEAQDLVAHERSSRFPDAYVKVQLGTQVCKTKPVQSRTMNPTWNEDLMIVAAEPFDEPLMVSVEDRLAGGKEESLGQTVVYLNTVEKRADDRTVRGKWFLLEKSVSAAIDEAEKKEEKKKERFASRIHLRVCLDGGYHVFDEPTQYSSDLRPSAKPLWKASVGILELGILNADGIHPMKPTGTSDTYCVAKYGHKWVRTRTVVNSLNPKYNEQYTWEVYDPATVLTVGVFDNSIIGHHNGNNNITSKRDVKIGKVRVRISTLQTGRVYTNSYPLLVLHPSGVKKMGELHLAIRFSCTSLANMMFKYTRARLPKMHYVRPLPVMQQEMLRHQAVGIVAARLGRAEPPLRREVVEYMSDADSHLWSMRRSKANFFRLMNVLSGAIGAAKWLGEVCGWRNSVTTLLVHALYIMLVCFPELILPTIFLYMFLIGLWNFRRRPKFPPHMDARLSRADAVMPDELDEEFDTYPTSRPADLVRARYDRLRSVAGRIQTVVGDVATQGERFQALLSWRDTRATMIFVVFCLVAAVVLYVTPFQVIAMFAGLYVMRHPRFRRKTPSPPLNFFRRLPSRTDSML